jgi:broad specificity phosphatase PhoE
MGSSEKYWQYARECAKWAKAADKEDDKDILRRMSKAWAHLARAQSDVARETSLEPEGRLHS